MTEEEALHPAPAATEPISPPPAPAPVVPPVVGARQLIGTSFELILRLGDPLRRASFYVGLIVLGTGGPLALALWGSLLVGYDPELLASQTTTAVAGIWIFVLGFLLAAGIIVASIDSTGVSIALLGGELSGRPVTIRQAVQRSRMVFWSIVVATLLVNIPTTFVQQLIGQTTEASFVAGLVVGTLIQTPFVYAAAGIVLGGVGPIEALKRSVRIARARKIAALILAILPSVYGLLILVAFSAGIDLAARAIEALGLGMDSGPAGVAVLTVLIVMVTFALGTLLFTATAIIYAPQVVMFVGLTRATMGLDRVRAGGDNDPDHHGPERQRFRWLTRPMLLGFALGALGLAGFLATIGS